MILVNGWHLFTHPQFLDQIERLILAVEAERTTMSDVTQTANIKLLAALRRLVFETVPADPTRPEYRQGGTLGSGRKHWFRAKFGGQRFRLFFRYDSRAKVIIYAWVNDSQTLRTYGSRTDAYTVFRGMLDKDDPPDNWAALFTAASTADADQRFAASGASTEPKATEPRHSTPVRRPRKK